MTQITIGDMRRLLEGWADKPDDTEFRFYIVHLDPFESDSFGELTGHIHAPTEDDLPEYVAISIRDTEDMA